MEKSCKDPVWVAGMMYVNDEDVDAISRARYVECEHCGVSYAKHIKLDIYDHSDTSSNWQDEY